MFSQLQFVRLRSAENALKHGRIDEAYRLAMAPDIREHKRGAAILARLSEQFLERARDQYRADRFTEALMDLDKAEAGGALKDEIAKLRDNVRVVAAEARRRRQSRYDRLHAAKKRIEGGSLAAGRKMLDEVTEGDHDAVRLRRHADQRAGQAASMSEQIEQLMNQSQYAAAAGRMRKLKAVDTHADGVAALEKSLCDRVIDKAKAALIDGKIKRANDELGCLGSLGKQLPARRELADMIAIARDAANAVQAQAFAQARLHAMSLERLLPEAVWVREAVAQLRQLEELTTAVTSGPLGTAVTAATTEPPEREPMSGPPYAKPMSLDDTVALPPAGLTDGELPRKLLLLVDGGGSYLIIRGGRASMGRAASSDPADIPVFSDVASRHANIERVDDDYFLFSAKDVEVAGHDAGNNHLLRHGDRIVLGKKAKLTFRVPSRKSPSGVLDLSDTTKMPNDVRRVILFNQQALLGAGPHAHVRCRHAGSSMVLFERDGRMWIRQRSDGHNDTTAKPLPIGETVEIGGTSVALEPWRVRPPGMSMI